MQNNNKEERQKVLVSIPTDLLQKIGRLAVRHNRSRNGEIVTLLQASVDEALKSSRPRPNDEDGDG